MTEIYGVDPAKPINAEEVRDAMVRCFEAAHLEVEKKALKNIALDFSGDSLDKLVAGHTERIVRQAFKDTGGDFDKPEKKSILAAINWLADYSKNFRKPEIIKKHAQEIRQLAERLA